MRHPLLDVVESHYKRAGELEFAIGDTVVVTTRIIEGEKERLQDYEGTVIARKGHGLDTMFTVRKIVANEGVERTFPMHSPKVVSIKTLRSGKIRRGKLYFLRDRVGKSRKLREKRMSAEARKAVADARAEKARVMQEAQNAVRMARSSEPRTAELAGSAR